MNLRLDGRTYRGRALDLRGSGTDADPDRVRRALELDPDDPLAVVTASPPSLLRALASAARTRGHAAPQDDRVATLERQLAETRPVDGPDLAAARARAAEAAADVERLRERVATARGRLQATRSADGDAGTDGDAAAAEREHARAARDLAAAETDRVAADQSLAAATRRASERRAASRRALRLRDELANRRREARRHLARRVYPAFAAAAARLPGAARPGDDPSAFEGDPVTGHLAAVAVADRAAPVVLAVERFGGPAEAATRLGAPVVQL